MREIAACVIGGSLYGVAFCGYIMLFNEEILNAGRKFRVRGRLSAARKRYRDVGALRKHLNQILLTTIGGRVGSGAFLWFCAVLFLGTSAVAARSMNVFVACLTGLITALVPYFILRIKLEIIRKRGSFEGESFIGNFLSAYRISNCNIFEAMEKTGRGKQKTRTCSELISRILIEMRNTTNHAEISRVAGKFSYAINTNWSRIFAYNIEVAVTNGTNISLAIEDILIQLREAKASCEERKRINAEAARLVKFFVPVLYFTSAYMSVKHMGIPIERFFYNQIFTAQGFMMFSAAILLFVINLVLIEYVNNKQFDY